MSGSNDKSLLFFGVLVTALTYLAVRPVTLPCIACDSGGLFYRCLDGTGLNSVTCEAWTKGIMGTNAIKKELMTVSEYSSELIKFASHLPQYLTDFASALLVKIREIAAEVYVRLQNVAAIAKAKMTEVFKSLKDIVLDAWDTVYDRVIKPVMAAVMKYVLEPMTELMAKIVSFAKLVIGGVSDMLDKGGKIVSIAYNAVYKAGEALSESIEFVMRKTAQIIEKVVDGIRTGLNKGLSEVVGAAEATVNTLSNSVGTIVSGIETGVNTTVKGATDLVETGVNKVGGGIDTVVGSVETGINSGLTAVGTAAQTALTGVTNGVEDSVNTLGESVTGGLGSVLDETEKIVNDLGGVLETTVNDTISLLNTGLIGPIESTINSSADVVQSALTGIMVPVRAITGALDKIGDVHIKLPPVYDGYPFSFLTKVDVPNVPKIGKIDIKDIKSIALKDANLPGIKYVRPNGAKKALGRQRLQASIANAQKNWQFALGQATSKHPYQGCREEGMEDVQALKPNGAKNVGLRVYNDAQGQGRAPHTYEFLPPLGSNSAANDTVSQMRQGVTPEQVKAKVSVGAVHAAFFPEHSPTGLTIPPAAINSITVKGLLTTPAVNDVIVKVLPTTPATNDIIVKGIEITAPTLPAVPKVTIDKPNLSVKLSVDPVVIPKPPKNPVHLTAPQVKFDVELDSKVPQVPNVVQGIQDGVSALGELLSRFFKPVWSAYATVTAMINTTITMVMHFFQEELSWQKIYGGVMMAAQRGWQGVKEVANIVYNEVILPLVDVLWFLKDKIVWMAKEFASMAMTFLSDIVTSVEQLGEAVWSKVKPALKQAAIVTSGVAVYSLSQLIDRIPGMSLLPATATTKLYMVLVVLVLFLVGSQVKFVKGFISGFLTLAMGPVVALDQAFDTYVRGKVGADSVMAKLTGIR